MKNIVSFGLLVMLCVVSLTLGGCSTPTVQTAIEPIPSGFTPSMLWNEQFVWDEWVRSSEMRVAVYPQTKPDAAPTAVFFPFIPTVTVRDPLDTGTIVAKVFWQEWLREAPFSVLEFRELTTSYTPAYAVKLAKERGALFAVTGTLTDFYDGGSVTGARLGVTLNIYDTRTGALIWSMNQFAYMDKDRTRDFLLFKARTRLPSDPMWVVTTAIAECMKKPVKQWTGQWAAVEQQNNAEENAAF
ncbi:hypothetical protein [Halodesulfovibrio sp.]|jgi:hypothetical protein|uniref:hypothetical protein n=1 Tax=Halodesulfovibrio sp. TaxID=1912772 RepID=UPI0025D893C5|nr:hypothetical protein [Halodesulfovibrio sp.]MCT4535473.1 hypothetical protein [Halodesulfovibrio sp.]